MRAPAEVLVSLAVGSWRVLQALAVGAGVVPASSARHARLLREAAGDERGRLSLSSRGVRVASGAEGSAASADTAGPGEVWVPRGDRGKG